MQKPEDIDLTNTYIELFLTCKTYLNDFFMNFISYYIGAKSTINYHMLPARKGKLVIPIYPYELDESHDTPITLIKHKLNELENTISNINWNNMSKQYFWLIHSMIKLGFSPMDSIQCKIVSDSLPIKEEFSMDFPIQINVPQKDKDNIKVERIVSEDGSVFTTVMDPHVIDYGIYVDLSVPFNDMGMMSNGLHLYEHMVTKAWDNLNETDCVLINGTTSAAGTSYIYSLHRTYDSFKLFVDATMNFVYKARDKTFWESQKMKDALKVESIRTISETRIGRSHSLMARSDFHAYGNGYGIDVFHYWSNRPFNILCVVNSPSEFFITKDKLDKISKRYPINKVLRPPNRKYKQIPVEVLITKMVQKYKIEKVKPLENMKRIYSKKIEKNTLYGIDCKLSVDMVGEENVEKGNSNLHALLFYNRLIDEKTLNDYCNKYVLPFSNFDYISSITAKFSSEFYL